jgi:Secretion system C-terminal sorting domain
MKNIYLILLVVLLSSTTLKAQISFEHNFSRVVEYDYSEGDYYYSVDYVSNQCNVYNLDYSIKKSVNISVPANWYLNDVAYVSKNMFNNDDLIEMLVVFYRYVAVSDTTGYYEYTTKVINENGTELLNVQNGGYSYIYTDGEGKSKLMIYTYDFSVDPVTYGTNIYSIPGAPSSIQNKFEKTKGPSPFPNPTKGMIQIPFKLKNIHSKGSIIITDINGQVIINHSVSGKQGTFSLDTGNLSSGQYLYTIMSPGMLPSTKKFIVR